jgi:predicted trehalose synthase
MVLTRHLAAAIAALATGVAAAAIDGQPQPNTPVITCTNPHSGTTWQISIDYARATVDANPAQVSEAKISWHDSKDGGNYTLDRRTGELTVVVASSTGGYFLHHRCRLPP